MSRMISSMKHDSSLGMPLRFMGIGLLAIVVISSFPNAVFLPLNRTTAYLSGSCLNLFGMDAKVDGTVISLNGFQVQIITECTALYCIVLFSAFLLAIPASFRARLAGLVIGAAYLVCANILRIVAVTAVGAVNPRLFQILHVYLGQVMMVVLVCTACLVWLRWTTAVRGNDQPLGFLIRFVGVASILFILWLPIHREYVALLDRLVMYLFSLAGFPLVITLRPEIYHHTLSLIVFVSLVCASRGIAFRRKAYGLAAGLLLLASVHVIFRVNQVLVFDWRMAWLLPPHLIIHVVNQYLLPVLLWLVVIRGGRGNVEGVEESELT